MGYETMKIGPTKAAELLAKQRVNRNISNHVVSKYAREMQVGRWMTSLLCPLVIDADGRLLDGQHRLTAIIESGIEIEMVVVRSDPQQVDVMSENRARTVADRFRIFDGYTTGNINSMISALRRSLYRMRFGALSTKSDPPVFSADEVRDTIKILAGFGCDINAVVQDADRIYRTQLNRARILPHSAIMYCMIDGSTENTFAEMTRHLEAICSDDAMARTPAQKAVRVRLMNTTGSSLRNAQIFAVIRAFNDPSLRKIQIESRTPAATYVPDVEGGFFETHHPLP
jgi:hypothetical protein